MSRSVPAQKPNPTGPVKVVRAGPALYVPAARRLVSQLNPDIDAAAKRLVESGPSHGIDFGLCWVTLEPGSTSSVSQACLMVLGAGKTAMVFLSEPSNDGESERGPEERCACLRAACENLRKASGKDIHIAQALPEHAEAWSVQALNEAGFIKVGDLSYVRRDVGRGVAKAQAEDWPEGVEFVRFSRLPTRPDPDSVLIEAMEATYEGTLDCPELCGLRETTDVLASHRSTGEYDPSLWWVAFWQGRPRGCVLLNRCPDQRSVELVYMGLGDGLRGKGLSRRMLLGAMNDALSGRPGWAVTCAVDERNTPALSLYRGLGFKAFTRRVAMVRPLRA